MPSRDRAQIRIEVLGAIKAALEARTTAEAFDELGDNVSQAERAAIAATFAVKGLTRQVRQLGEASLFAGLSLSSATIAMTGMRIAAYGLAAIALPALAVALGHVAAAAGAWTVAFTGGMFAIAAAAGLMAAGVIGRFRLMRNVAGSAANDLATQAGLLKHTFLDVTATGADRIMRGLADAITDLLPLLRQLAPSFDAIGQAAGSLFRSIGAQLATMGPELQVMFAQLVPVLTEAGPLLGKLLGFLIQIGTVGAPLVASAFRTISGWLDHWTATFTGATLQHAQDTLRGFAASIGAFFAGIGEPLRGVLGPAIADLAAAWQANGREIGRTLGLLAAILVRLGRVVLPLVITGIKILGGLLAWVNKHFHTLLTIATPLAIAIGAYQVAATGAAAASKLLGVGMAIYRTAAALATGQTLALDAAMAANPIGLVVAAIALLAAGLVLAYKKVGWFRDAVN
ncbi:MAG TPA: hypothetical protein VHB30_00565, partial [Solirubrobacteraceae bacterium]|nr:hypothetical protein [Solirubrobacteraceae bacterium]